MATSAPAAWAAAEIAGRSLNSIVIEPGVSTQTSLVFGLICAEMPAPMVGS